MRGPPGPSHEVILDIRDALLAGQSWSVIGQTIGKSKNSIASLVRRRVYTSWPSLQAELAVIRPPVGGRPKGAAPQGAKVKRAKRPPSLHAPKTVIPVPKPALVVAPEPAVRQCQYILNDGRPWRFCDQPVERTGTVYCSAHHAVCYHRRAALP